MKKIHAVQMKSEKFSKDMRALAAIHETEVVVYRPETRFPIVSMTGLTETEALAFKKEFGGSVEYREYQDDWRWKVTHRKAREYLAVIRACLGIQQW